jgi:hypothetical protein
MTKEMTMKHKEIHICECGIHAVGLSRDDISPEIYMSWWSYGQHLRKWTVINRLKACWRYLKTGEWHDDEIILDIETAKEMATKLFEYANYFTGGENTK